MTIERIYNDLEIYMDWILALMRSKIYDKKRMPYGEKKIQLLLQMKMRFFLWVTRHMRCLKKRLTI